MIRLRVLCASVVFGLCAVGAAMGAPVTAGNASEGADQQAQKMLRRGMALLEDRQEDRAEKVIEGVALNFPKSKVRFKALLLLGKLYSEKGDYALAIKKLAPVMEAEEPDEAEPDEKAEAEYRIGICHYGESDYDRALMTFRRVTDAYPWSVYANEAYYYIGLCHFRLERWGKAVEALKMVGTSVPPNEKARSLVESGQRFLIKVNDKDLRVLKVLDKTFDVTVTVQSGDTENTTLTPFDVEGEYFLGSVKMELGTPVPNDGKLQVKGGDTINVTYTDSNTEGGERQIKRLGVSRVVSTSVAGFMDGAFREYVHGVFADQRTFMRVKDFDADVSDQKDKVKVRIYSQRRIPREELELAEDYDPEAPPKYELRDSVEIVLEETAGHSGFFAGSLVLTEAADASQVTTGDSRLSAVRDDEVCLEYVDKEHIGGLDDPRIVTTKAQFLTGGIPDVWIAHREVGTEELRARKNLIEARFFLRLAQIFRDVGLVDRANDKAGIGLEKVSDILQRSLKASIGQDTMEAAYQLKWELMLAKGDLTGAIYACRTLMTLFPSSSLADVALMQIAKANVEADDTRAALQILNGVLGLKADPGLKAEAQFLIATVLEKGIAENISDEQRMRAMGPVVSAYKTCADKYPESPFAGQALGKVIDFHLTAKNYDRCEELLQSVFTDFPDAPFLDDMLLKWGLVLARKSRHAEARDKLQLLLRDYPNSASAAKAKKMIEILSRQL